MQLYVELHAVPVHISVRFGLEGMWNVPHVHVNIEHQGHGV